MWFLGSLQAGLWLKSVGWVQFVTFQGHVAAGVKGNRLKGEFQPHHLGYAYFDALKIVHVK